MARFPVLPAGVITHVCLLKNNRVFSLLWCRRQVFFVVPTQLMDEAKNVNYLLLSGKE